MSRWRCRFYRTLLVDAADGALADRQRRRLQRHIARCPGCAEELAALRDVPPLLQSSAPADPGEAFWRQQREAIGRAIRNLPEPRRTWLPGWWREGLPVGLWRYPLAAAAAVLIALFVYRLAERPSAPEPGESQVAALDTESLLFLRELAQALAPGDEQIPQIPDDETSLAALPARDLLGVSVTPDAPQATDLTESELEGIDVLVGDIG